MKKKSEITYNFYTLFYPLLKFFSEEFYKASFL